MLAGFENKSNAKKTSKPVQTKDHLPELQAVMGCGFDESLE
jgi:hypothetical protein